MRILFIVPYIPSRVRSRSYNIIRTLHERGHEITLVLLQPPGEPDSTLSELSGWSKALHVVPLSRVEVIRNGLRGLLSPLPIQASYSESPATEALIRELVSKNQYDVAHVEHLRGYVFIRALGDLPVVWDTVDSITLLFEKVIHSAPSLKSRLMAQLDLARTRRFEGRVTDELTEIAICSDLDKRRMVELGANPDRLVYVPSCVDVNYFKPMPEIQREPRTLIFSGKMSYHANVAAVQDLVAIIMPLVWAQEPETRLQIVGKDPGPEILALAEADKRIEVTGFVPDIRPYQARATLAACYVRYGVGLTTKTVESMAMGTPIVASPHAVSTLKVEHGREVLVGETPEKIAEHILTLLRDPAKAAALGAAGRQYVDTYQRMEYAASLLEQMYERAKPAILKQG
jgi:glycosyltransferase involved in cell wall biosynthesis